MFPDVSPLHSSIEIFFLLSPFTFIRTQSGATGSVDMARLEELERQLLEEKALRAKAEMKLYEVVSQKSK